MDRTKGSGHGEYPALNGNLFPHQTIEIFITVITFMVVRDEEADLL
jgi:hypothetical protein